MNMLVIAIARFAVVVYGFVKFVNVTVQVHIERLFLTI